MGTLLSNDMQNRMKVMCFSIPYYFFGIGCQAYRELLQMRNDVRAGNEKDGDQPVIFCFAQRYVDPDTKRIGVLDRLWILGLLLGSPNLCGHDMGHSGIAKRPDQVPGLREEILPETYSDGPQRLTYASCATLNASTRSSAK
ncbi:hypothetical protein CVT25_009934 [Psilocybe cyanescens]|uniref:Uncharacterized protein n=1 Tax=Psilocybe cyanescens TaxID=93625 RepID=A0A409XCW8_PSICY|nr:hypothetical protein CVT25_009934 [Psilocybe cyanescens]